MLQVGGRKFDLRIYALVLSYTPLRVYLYRSGFARFTNQRFSMNREDISNPFIHLTNVAVQKTAPGYDPSKQAPDCSVVGKDQNESRKLHVACPRWT